MKKPVCQANEQPHPAPWVPAPSFVEKGGLRSGKVLGTSASVLYVPHRPAGPANAIYSASVHAVPRRWSCPKHRPNVHIPRAACFAGPRRV